MCSNLSLYCVWSLYVYIQPCRINPCENTPFSPRQIPSGQSVMAVTEPRQKGRACGSAAVIIDDHCADCGRSFSILEQSLKDEFKPISISVWLQ